MKLAEKKSNFYLMDSVRNLMGFREKMFNVFSSGF